MNVLLVGSGGREHAIAKKIKESKRLKQFYAVSKNPGIAHIAEIAPVDEDDNKQIVQFAKEKNINLIVCGPEKPLVNKLADMASEENIPVFGPKYCGARLEGSKIYSKQFMTKYGIPTADFYYFESYEDAKKFLNKKITYPTVIKADGLAAGKGVKIVKSQEEALTVIKEFMVDKIHGESGSSIIVEDFMLGEEMSNLYITDGKSFLPLLPAKDYKKALNNDQGDNTGGMGSYAPHVSITNELKEQIENNIVKKIKAGFIAEKIEYRGVLYIGIILTDEGPKVLEFNCRFGDPETQAILPLIENDLLEIMLATAKGKLDAHAIKWKNDYSACIVIASGGYPHKYQKGLKINFVPA